MGSYESKNCEHVGKEGLRNTVMLPTLSYVSETWMWNVAQQSQLCPVEMSYCTEEVHFI